MPPVDLTTMAGVITGLGIVVTVLWRSHEKSDQDMKIDRDYWRSLALTGVDIADRSTTIAVRKRSDG